MKLVKDIGEAMGYQLTSFTPVDKAQPDKEKNEYLLIKSIFFYQTGDYLEFDQKFLGRVVFAHLMHIGADIYHIRHSVPAQNPHFKCPSHFKD